MSKIAQYCVDGNIQSYSYLDEEGELIKKRLKIDGDDLVIPNTIIWNDEIFMVNQVVLTKEIFQKLYKEWILEATNS